MVLGWGGLAPLISDGAAAEERLVRGEIDVIGVADVGAPQRRCNAVSDRIV